jgi:hypothetical protein
MRGGIQALPKSYEFAQKSRTQQNPLAVVTRTSERRTQEARFLAS